MSWTEQEMNEVYLEVQKRAMADEEFRADLLANPNAAIEELTGKKLPEDFKIKVVENEPGYAATFVLPDLLGEEIEDDDLDDVAGGVSIVVGITACAAAIGISACPADACAANASLEK